MQSCCQDRAVIAEPFSKWSPTSSHPQDCDMKPSPWWKRRFGATHLLPPLLPLGSTSSGIRAPQGCTPNHRLDLTRSLALSCRHAAKLKHGRESLIAQAPGNFPEKKTQTELKASQHDLNFPALPQLETSVKASSVFLVLRVLA